MVSLDSKVRSSWERVGDTYYLTVTGFPLKGLNALMRYGHIWQAPNYKRDILSLVSTPGKPCIKGKAAVLYVRTYKGRPLDQDNMSGAFKAVQDALVRAGIIEGDEMYRLVAEYQQRKRIRGGADWLVAVRQAPPVSGEPCEVTRTERF
jgi:hypothetical protein